MTPEYRVWLGMHQRCSNPKVMSYPNYGGRGIRVCPLWFVFETFLKDMGSRPDGMSVERINNDGNYEPCNCRWATVAEQAQNRRSSRRFMWRGVEYTTASFARILGLSVKTTANRLRRADWNAELVYQVAQLSQPEQWKLRSSKLIGKRVTNCKRGHEYTPENTYVDPKGYRNCRICRGQLVAERIHKQVAVA